MKIGQLLSTTLAISTIGLLASDPAAGITAEDSIISEPIKQGLTYEELFDIEENFVDAAVAVMLATDPNMEELLIDIRSVRVSSDGKYAMVGWVYNREYGGTTLMEQHGEEILVLIENEGGISRQTAEAYGIPAYAAEEIAPY